MMYSISEWSDSDSIGESTHTYTDDRPTCSSECVMRTSTQWPSRRHGECMAPVLCCVRPCTVSSCMNLTMFWSVATSRWMLTMMSPAIITTNAVTRVTWCYPEMQSISINGGANVRGGYRTGGCPARGGLLSAGADECPLLSYRTLFYFPALWKDTCWQITDVIPIPGMLIKTLTSENHATHNILITSYTCSQCEDCLSQYFWLSRTTCRRSGPSSFWFVTVSVCRHLN